MIKTTPAILAVLLTFSAAPSFASHIWDRVDLGRGDSGQRRPETSTVPITFEGASGLLNPATTRYTEGTANLYSDNYSFDVSSGHMHLVGEPTLCSLGGCVSSATGHYAASEGTLTDGSWGQPIHITRADGISAQFDLIKFDAAELFLAGGNANATSILVFGLKAGATLGLIDRRILDPANTIVARFDLDGIRDGLGGANDFQTFFLPSTFTDLTSVVFLGTRSPDDIEFEHISAFALDNIVVTAVPEPSTITLFSLGLASLWYFRRRSVARRLRA